MRLTPPPSLVESLGKLALASPGQIESVAARVRRLARDLPGFEFLWVDALAQARILTPFQAVEINAGRSAELAVGPFTLCEPLETLGYATVYRARDSKTRGDVRLAIVAARPEQSEVWPAQFEALKRRTAGCTSTGAIPIESWGQSGQRFWITCRHVPGRSTADWLLHNGRMPPEIVEELARQMCATLAEFERAKVVYGDFSPRQIVLTPAGAVVLPMPGIRPIVRPMEGYADASLLPEVYDYIAPERIAAGRHADVLSDLYACGAVWWHLLAGRPPIAGASGLAKLRGAQTQKIIDIQQLAPDTPPRLAKAIGHCLNRDPSRRPASFGELEQMLTAGTPENRKAVVRSIARQQTQVTAAPAVLDRSCLPSASKCLIAIAGVLLVLTVATWPQWGGRWLRREATPASPNKSALLVSHRHPTPIEPVAPAVSPAASTPTPTGLTRRIASGREVWRLPAGRQVQAHQIPLHPGMTISGGDGRAVIEVPAGGWKIDVDDLAFEYVDFVCSSGATSRDGPQTAAMIDLNVRRIAFKGCTWQISGVGDGRVVGISWYPQGPASDTETLATGKIGLRDCLFRGIAAALRCGGRSTWVIEAENTLHLGPGAFIRLDQPPASDESLLISASHMTLRDARALVECAMTTDSQRCGKISIAANDCAFVPAAGAGLLTFVGDSDPGSLVEQLEWIGQGSVLAPQTPLAVWETSDGQIKATADDQVQVAGLVLSQVEFAGAKDGAPAASQVIRWQVPLQSTDPPGIRENFSLLPGTRR